MKKFTFKVIIIFLILLTTIVFLEFASIMLYPAMHNEKFSRVKTQNKLLVPNEINNQGLNRSKKLQRFQKNHILHPYLGFVGNPGVYSRNWEFSRNNQTTVINEAGFLGESPLTKKEKNTLTICILGGSFAMNFYLDSKDVLKKELLKLSQFKGKHIKIVSMAMSGYKQPQQLLAITYFLSLGAEYDIVINLDGFNEVALPLAENISSDVYPFFPRLWNIYSSNMLDIESTLQFSTILETKQNRLKLREFFSLPLLSFSNFALILWEILDDEFNNNIYLQTKKLEKLSANDNDKSATRNYQRSGPSPFNYLNQDYFFSALVEQWGNSSKQISALGKRNGFTYFHLLQPNQYVENSKTFTEEEEAKAYFAGHAYNYKIAVKKGYPLLIATGKKLQEKNINFQDLTMLYKGTKESVYEDTCCHVNKVGNDIVAKQITFAISEYFKN